MAKLPRINCNSCLKRSTCQFLCGAAEQYASQDNVSCRERLIGNVLYSDLEWPTISDNDHLHLSDRQITILTLISSGVTREIVSKTLRLSHAQLNDAVYRIRKKIREIDAQ